MIVAAFSAIVAAAENAASQPPFTMASSNDASSSSNVVVTVMTPLMIICALSAVVSIFACQRRIERKKDAESTTDSDTDRMEEGVRCGLHVSSSTSLPEDSTLTSSATPHISIVRTKIKSSLIQTLEMIRVDEDHCGPVDIDHSAHNDDEREDCSVRSNASIIFDDTPEDGSASYSTHLIPESIFFYNSKNDTAFEEEAWIEFQHSSSNQEENGSVADAMEAWKRPGYKLDMRWQVLKRSTTQVEL